MFDFNKNLQGTEYERTGNPLLAWDMILECCKKKEHLPEWVMKYLEGVAEELVNLSPSKKRVPEEIRDALGFKGKPFKQYQDFLNRAGKDEFNFLLSVANRVGYERRHGAKKIDAYMAAGKYFFGEDEQTENHWRDVQRCCLKYEKHMKNATGENEKKLKS